MKFFTFATVISMMASSMMAIPIEKRDASPYEITYPTSNEVVQINSNLAITWNKGDNSPINIGLVAGEDGSLSSNSIVVAEGISGSIGTVVYPISPSLGNGTNAWRVAISHSSDPVVYSAPFYISSSSSSSSQPNYTATASNATYSAVASITILGPDGRPLTFNNASSAASTSFGSNKFYTVLPISTAIAYLLL
ncbi:unnamed protein product [Cunninghamella blakesleeana]